MLAMILFQNAELSSEYVKYLTIFVGILAVAILLIAFAVAFLAVKVVAILTDVKKTFDETKVKAMPLIAKVTEITQTTQGVVNDLAPKIKTISENVVDISHTARQTVSKLDVTIRDAADKASTTFSDVDSRTKVQVARVDTMVAQALSATAEIGETVNQGIRNPARKIAAMVTQSKHLIDTLLDRAKALGIDFSPTVQAKTERKGTKQGW